MSDVERIEMSLEHVKAIVSRGDKALRLATNPDFKELVLDGYFKDEAVRLVHLKADPSFFDKDSKEEIENQMIAIAGFRQYLHMIVQMAQTHRNDLQEYEEALSDARVNDVTAETEEVPAAYDTVLGE